MGCLVAILGILSAGCGGGGGGNSAYSCGDIACYVPLGIAAADFNGDGRADLAIPIQNIAHGSGSSMDVYLQQPSGASTLAPAVSYQLTNAGTNPIAVDVNGDGHPDIVMMGFNSSTLSLLLNQPDNPGTFVLAPSIPAGYGLNEVAAADINGDGRVDLIEADGDGSDPAADGLSIHLQLAQSPGEFAPATFIPINGCCDSVAVGDVNGDGLPDLIAVGSGSGVVVLLQIPGQPGQFESATSLVAGPASRCVKAVDLDGDGLLDLVYGGTANASGSVTSVLVALQAASNPGHFLPPTSYAVAGDLTTCLVHDLTAKSHPDIIINAAKGISVLQHDPAHPGSFLAAVNYAVGQNLYIALADMNGDGLPDIVAEHGPSNSGPGVLYQNAARPGTFGSLQDLH
jgi:hypothetical protein